MRFRPSRIVPAALVAALALFAVSTCSSETGAPGPSSLGVTSEPVVYGEDDRTDVYAYADAAWRSRALSSAVALMNVATLDMSDPNDVRFAADTLGSAWMLCSDERFRDQPTAGFCSGTLIDDDLVLTAGHCVTKAADCASTAFVFRYAMAGATTLETVTADDVFYCDSIVAQVETTTLDYAVLKIDRPATPRFAPAPVQAEAGAVAAGTALTMIGCPSGIPQKIEDGGWVRDARASALDYFVANTDSFGGNSGSGVYDQATGAVVGVLVRGETDYVYDYYYGCYRVNYCGDNECGGEDSTYAFRAVEALCAAGYPSRLCGPVCGDGTCDADETTATCPADCGSLCGDGACNGAETSVDCPADCGAVCGDGACNGGETSVDCPADCGAVCGDGACNGGETWTSCPTDCPAPVCGDGVCNGDETTATCPADCGAACGDGACNGGESSVGCPEDCGAVCGDGACNGGEDVPSCPADCDVPSVCGDGVCDGDGEDCFTCAADCSCAGKDCVKVCCGDGVCSADEEKKGFCTMDCFGSFCGDGTCDADESTASCPDDCGTLCGDGVCNGTETWQTCATDCPAPVCGDGVCDDGETEASCPEDCSAPPAACGDGVCAGWEAGEDCVTCSTDCRCAGKDCVKVCCGDGVCSADEASKGFCAMDCP